ncbi:signal peptidase I [Halomicrobium salinisoli]|uniref:signal peptidase I n=1 Tax=Halomicrobium salinisoli TaxID=2878391 RepID=UPI001CF093E2|nr:signal peptidase I [Halomicrobium salinisoli]
MTDRPMQRTLTMPESTDWKRVVRVTGLAAVAAVVLLFVAAAVPQVAGADHSYVVLSDSMSPAIEAGDVVFVSDVPVDRIGEGDVVTYRGDGGRVTHRVVEVVETDSGPRFRTRGDANDGPDPALVSPDAVVGVVRFHVPLAGHVILFAQSGLGVLALVVVPAVLLIALEVRDLLAGSPGDDDAG